MPTSSEHPPTVWPQNSLFFEIFHFLCECLPWHWRRNAFIDDNVMRSGFCQKSVSHLSLQLLFSHTVTADSFGSVCPYSEISPSTSCSMWCCRSQLPDWKAPAVGGVSWTAPDRFSSCFSDRSLSLCHYMSENSALFLWRASGIWFGSRIIWFPLVVFLDILFLISVLLMLSNCMCLLNLRRLRNCLTWLSDSR